MIQETSSSTTKKTLPVPSTKSGSAMEYYYSLVKTIAQKNAAKAGSEKKSFRRGRIWA